MSEEVKIPVEMSVGGQNRHIHWCLAMNQRRFYGACLHLLDAYNAGRLKPEDVMGDCATAMARGDCEAANKRKQEIDADRAIFYVENTGTTDRPGVVSNIGSAKVDEESENYKRGWEALDRAKSGKPLPKYTPEPSAVPYKVESKKSEPSSMSAGDFADAINAEMRRLKDAESAPKKKSASKEGDEEKPAEKPVESVSAKPMTFAERVKAMKEKNHAA